MHLLIGLIRFAADDSDPEGPALASLCHHLKREFGLQAKAHAEDPEGPAIVIVKLGARERLPQSMDDVLRYCERKGYGRIEHSQTQVLALERVLELKPYDALAP